VHGLRPNLGIIFPYYAKGYYHVTTEERKGKGKFYPKAKDCDLMGVILEPPGGYILKTEKGSIIQRRDVYFQEMEPPIKNDEINQTMVDENEQDPLTWEDIINSKNKEKWIEATNKEINQMLKLNTFEFVEDKCERILNAKMVWRKSTDNEGNAKYKARFVIVGAAQKPIIDYNETFSPTVSFKTAKVILNLIVILGLHKMECDVCALRTGCIRLTCQDSLT